MAGVTLRLPLFPLGTVLVPGLVLPLHVFEHRYRVLVEHLLARPEPERRFGVVAIRAGSEVGEDAVHALYAVGCTALVRRVTPRADGRFDLVTTGAERFRLLGLERDQPYLVGRVEPLPERDGDLAALASLAPAVRAAFADHLRALAATGDAEAEVPDLPRDARTVSYLVAAATRVDLEDRQALLELPDDAERLRAGLALLRRENALVRRLAAVPAPELARSRISPN